MDHQREPVTPHLLTQTRGPRIMRVSSRALLLGASAALLGALPGQAQSFSLADSQIPSGSPSNNSSSENVDFADVDLDGDFDAVFADGGDDGNDRNRIWINMGGLQGGTVGFFDDQTPSRLPTGNDTSRDIDFVDIDGDGDDDIYVSNTSTQSNQSNKWWINQGGAQAGTAGFFVDESTTRWVNIGVNNGSTSSSVAPSFVFPSGGFIDWSCDCIFGDLDNDGDMDLIHTSYGAPVGGSFTGTVPTRLFLNDGLGFFEEFNPSGFQLSGQNISNGNPALWAEGVHQHDTQNSNGGQADIAATPLGVEIGDLDGDFDLDLLIGAREEQPRLFLNKHSELGSLEAFRDVTFAAFSQTVVLRDTYEQELGDLDNDNDLDIYGLNWGGSFQVGQLNDVTVRNDGSMNFGSFTTAPGSQSDDNEPDWFDYNNDGNLDVYVSNFSGRDRLYENSGAPGYSLSNVTNAELPFWSQVALGADSCDVDNDGDFDVMVANDNFGANRLVLNTTQIADTHAPRVVSEQAPDQNGTTDETPIRVALYENGSWDTNRRSTGVLEYTVNGGGVQSVPLVYIGGQLFRGVIPAGTVGNVQYTAKMTDLGGNVGVSATLSFSVSGGTVNYCTAGTSAAGCQALMSTTGTPSATAASGFNFVATGVEGQKDGLFFFGANGRQANSWGSSTSFQCVVPPVIRGGLLTAVGTIGACDGSFSQDMNALWQAKPVKNPGAGAVVQGQLWYRDPLNTSNQTTSLSDAIEFTVQP